ncbi:hypothetical protein ISF_06699 [Cordyceps fumosorosea ARSEF 2679]|uniref:Uncharacterized protein n=1 Tax=Cordyceps fumosorosea (strain ARSEF 2679) TaxID=1081104 RepID=A0A167R0H0_CORFA|nr:hypothetical protein ISF_06699 [Cordyceps fumosorosea ARSEF 2679]OAA58160.1 hypothetical protein ISF_06699 [Cordyceps fumosorosea ARSEF 2679]
MSSGSEQPPPSYSEATSQASTRPQDSVRPEGWVEGYVEAPPADQQAAGAYHPPAAAADEKKPSEAAAPVVRESGTSSAEAAAVEQQQQQQTGGRLSFGGLDLGGRVLGYGSGEGVGGWGLKIGPVMLGLVDVEAEKLRRKQEGAERDD